MMKAQDISKHPLFSLLEPDAARLADSDKLPPSMTATDVSIAISLKRIADALENRLPTL